MDQDSTKDFDLSSKNFTDSDDDGYGYGDQNVDLMADLSDNENGGRSRRTKRRLGHRRSHTISRSQSRGRRRAQNRAEDHPEIPRFAQSAGSVSLRQQSSAASGQRRIRVSVSGRSANSQNSVYDRISEEEPTPTLRMEPTPRSHVAEAEVHQFEQPMRPGSTSTPMQAGEQSNQARDAFDNTYVNVNPDLMRIPHPDEENPYNHTYGNIEVISRAPVYIEGDPDPFQGLQSPPTPAQPPIQQQRQRERRGNPLRRMFRALLKRTPLRRCAKSFKKMF